MLLGVNDRVVTVKLLWIKDVVTLAVTVAVSVTIVDVINETGRIIRTITVFESFTLHLVGKRIGEVSMLNQLEDTGISLIDLGGLFIFHVDAERVGVVGYLSVSQLFCDDKWLDCDGFVGLVDADRFLVVNVIGVIIIHDAERSLDVYLGEVLCIIHAVRWVVVIL